MFLGHAPADHAIDHRFDHGGGNALTLEAGVASNVMIHARVGVEQQPTPITDTRDADYQRLMEVNVRGIF